MEHTSRSRRRNSTIISLLLFLLCICLSSYAQAQRLPAGKQGPSVAWKPPSPNSPDMVGNDRCRSCHKAEFTEFGKTAHAKLKTGETAVMACETCHGPGKPHADAEEAAHGDEAKTAAANKLIFAFYGSVKENSERCMSCHQSGKEQELFEHSEHFSRGVSCSNCHAAHLVNETKDQSKGDLQDAQAHFFDVPRVADEARWLQGSLLKESEPNLCYSCHGTIQAQFALPVRHRVPEGLVKCTDCHNPHGTMNRAELQKTGSETCVTCHVEKRGPFVFEHPAAKVEGCVSCHNPHGSINRTLLVRREGRELCLQCHAGFNGQAQVPHGRFSFQTSGDCVRCHVAIHGSNFDANFLR